MEQSSIKSNHSFPKGKTKDQSDLQYSNDIKEDKDSIFFLITSNRVNMWKDFLLKRTNSVYISDADILNTLLNIKQQSVIKNDCNRTRVREATLLDSFKDYLEFILTHYCKQEKIKYKQGLNEIFGPFILLKYKISISLADIYLLAKAFIDKYLTNSFTHQYKESVELTLYIYNHLLRYHEPLIYSHLEKYNVVPKLYAFNWISTLFANKFRLDVIYQLWDYIISLEDPLLIHYIIVAFLQMKRIDILSINDDSNLLQYISNLVLDNVNEVHQLIQNAAIIKSKTPYSIVYLTSNIEVYKLNNTNLKQTYDLWSFDNILAMPIFSTEILYHSYKSLIHCPDEKCNIIKKESKSLSLEKKRNPNVCDHCDLHQIKSMSYLLIDLRLITKDFNRNLNEQTGFLPNLIMFSQEELLKDSFIPDLLQKFLFDKDTKHFIFLTSQTNLFMSYEEKYYFEYDYSQAYSIFDLKNMPKSIRKINYTLVNALPAKEKQKLFEYDLLKRVLDAFINGGYPYISYAYGGYCDIHDKALTYCINLLNHENNCSLCKGMSNRIKKIEKSTIESISIQSKNIEMKDLFYEKIIISNLKLMIPTEEISSNNDQKNKLFKIYDITKPIEFFLKDFFEKGETNYIECHLTIIKQKKETIIPNCFFIMNHYEFQMYNEEDQKITYIDKSLIFEIIRINYDKKIDQITIVLETKTQIYMKFDTHKRASSWYYLFNAYINKKI